MVPGGKNGKYGNAYGFYFRNGQRADSSDEENLCWCKQEETEPQLIPNAGCGGWFLLDIIGEPTAEGDKIYELDDILESGKHQGEKLRDVVINDYGWVEWAISQSDHFEFNIDSVIEFRKQIAKVIQPGDLMPFGKYQSKAMRDIYNIDPWYVKWLSENKLEFLIDFDLLENDENRPPKVMHFGKYEGKTMEEIKNVDPEYFNFLSDMNSKPNSNPEMSENK